MSRKGILFWLAPLALLLVTTPGWTQQRCDDADVGQWVKNIYGWTTSHDELARYAIEMYGPPRACLGEVTSEFDGNEFGRVWMRFSGGAVFEIETQPPEASIATLSDSSGFDDEATVRDVLKAYTNEIGLEIDWSDTTSTVDGKERMETYRDPDDGVNASARLVFRRNTLVSVRVSLAL
ncbi:MAG: hypothetical protein WBW88_19415 [Rhodothermales bacterium]